MAEKDIPGGGNRRIKDSMFVDLFGKDVSAKENFLSLYNALHGTDLRLEDTKLEPEMIDGAVYMFAKMVETEHHPVQRNSTRAPVRVHDKGLVR